MAYESVFAMAGYSVFRHACTEVDFCFIVEDTFVVKLLMSSPTKADYRCSRLLFRQALLFANTFVCVQRSCLCDESRSLDGRSGATFIRQLADCMLRCSKGQGGEHTHYAQCRLYNRCVCKSRTHSEAAVRSR